MLYSRALDGTRTVLRALRVQTHDIQIASLPQMCYQARMPRYKGYTIAVQERYCSCITENMLTVFDVWVGAKLNNSQKLQQ